MKRIRWAHIFAGLITAVIVFAFIAAVPAEDWLVAWRHGTMFWVLGGFLAAVLGWLIYFLLGRPEQLRIAIKQAKEELREREGLFHKLSEAAFEGFVIAEKGNILEVSPEFARLFGYEPSEMIGMNATELVVPDCRDVVMKKIAQNNEQSYEADAVRKDGSTFTLEAQGTIAFYYGKTVRITAVRDITERKLVEKELTEHRENLEEQVTWRTDQVKEQARIIDQIHDSVISTDLGGSIVSWNKGAERLFGYTVKEALGRPITLIYSPDKLQFRRDRIIAPLMEKGGHEVEVCLRRKNGEDFFAHMSLSLLYDEAGNTKGMIGYAMDITDRKKTEIALEAAKEEAERANRAKSEFLSNMSHELRTPMNAILGFGQLLEMEKESSLTPVQTEYIQEILKAGYHLLDLINDVLDLSKIESGHLELKVETLNVSQLVAECIAQIVSTLAHTGQISVDNRAVDPALYLHADQTRFRQILINLLSNAVKYNREGGTVTVDNTVGPEGRVRISVTDTGKGIAKEQLEKLFHPFERLEAKNSLIEGSGIGLSVAKRLVDAMGGAIGVESTLGKGSTFWFELPMAPV
ncbi:MAG TPA: PAS domain S-box protein [Acidiferrobacteraceae bacterium]|nr:PAS domain S-box protein [Acidiferrobacteraceae bacterium]